MVAVSRRTFHNISFFVKSAIFCCHQRRLKRTFITQTMSATKFFDLIVLKFKNFCFGQEVHFAPSAKASKTRAYLLKIFFFDA